MPRADIAVFETNMPHQPEDKVVLCSLQNDGLRLSKNKSRTDPFNNWALVKKDLLEKIQNPIQNKDQINFVNR